MNRRTFFRDVLASLVALWGAPLVWLSHDADLIEQRRTSMFGFFGDVATDVPGEFIPVVEWLRRDDPAALPSNLVMVGYDLAIEANQ